MCENDPEEQSKIIKYNDLLSNAVILHNVIDISNALKKLKEDEVPEPINRIDIEDIIDDAS